MEDISVDDDKKQFDAEGLHEEETQPDPDEQLMLDQGNGRVWLVKIPKYLMERWSAIDAEDVHLATIRVYHTATGPSGKKPRIVLFLPPNNAANDIPSITTPPPLQPPPPSAVVLGATAQNSPSNRPTIIPHPAYSIHRNADEPDSYELEMINDAVENQIVVAERPKDPHIAHGRARTTILTGRIKHECSLRPVFSESYRRQMKERSRKYNTPQRQIRMIEDAGVPGGRGGVNRLSSGVGVGAGSAFGNLVQSKPKPAKGTFERMARMPRNQLLDLIFSLFHDRPRWGIKPLRERTQQPEVYLKEVLSEVAVLYRSGEYNGQWELKDIYKGDGVKGEIYAGSSATDLGGDVKMEGIDEDGADDEDDDMEEVS